MILHIDPEKVWQGGQRQVVYLVEYLNKTGCQSAVVNQKGSPLDDYCNKHCIEHFSFNFRNKLNLAFWIRMIHYCLNNQVTLIHCHSSNGLSLGLQLKAFLPKVKLVASRRVDFHIKGKLSLIFKYNTPKLDKLICISKNILEVCKEDGIPQDKLHLIYSGIDLNRLATTLPPPDFIKNENLPDHDLLIGTIAAFVHHKDYPTLIQAAEIVLKKHPRVLFLSLGKGKLLDEMKQLTNKLGIADRFIFGGFRNEVAWFLNSFDIFTLASKYEGLGTSVLDALACGKACVCSNGGGIPEMIKHNENGLLFEARKPEELAKSLNYLIEHPSERERLAKVGLASVEKFSVEHTAKEHIKLYEELLNGKI